MIPSYYRSRI